MAAWDRQPGEGRAAYDHFCIYRDLGPGRTLEECRKVAGITMNVAEGYSARFSWVARTDQWDAHVRRLSDRAFLKEAEKKARARAAAYTKLLVKADEALRVFDYVKRPPTLGQIAAAMKVACEGMRLEDGLETSRVALEVHDFRLVIAAFPAPVRAEVLRVLDEYAQSGERSGDSSELPALAAGSPID
jgi:hypothetical protein